ncbi:MAG TPA: hypothetical protein VMF13_02400 [Luteitalea sp.]|nr:hypothetical protein [Luteitalea sp.]
MPDLTPSITDHDIPEIDLPKPLAVIGGAVLGGLAGYLLLTASGNRLRQDLLSGADGFFGGVNSLLATWDRVQASGLLGQNDRGASRPGRSNGAER